MKRSIAALDCMAVGSSEPKILERVGSAFLVSGAGDFLTAAHVVIEMRKPDRSCPTRAVVLPNGDWQPDIRTEPLRWFPFHTSSCRIDRSLDVALCRMDEDFSARRNDLQLKAVPVQFEWGIPPDGTQVAFTGFPLRSRDPITFRAYVAAFRIPWPDESAPELVLDHAALPGFSGSPVYLANGKVVGILVKDGKDEAAGASSVLPISAFREILRDSFRKE
jgi:hypothetical protein